MKKGWLDNYGKVENANDSNVSFSENYVGLGNDTKGRSYSPAWGGQFQDGGIIPTAQTGRKIDQILDKNKNLDWVQGLYDPNYGSIQIPGQKKRSTHFMESSDRRVYPTIRNINGELKYLGDDAYNYADSTNSYIEFPTDRKAKKFGKNYKRGTGVLELEFQDGGFVPFSPMQQITNVTGSQINPTPTVPYKQTKDPAEFYKSWITSPEYRRRKIETGYQEVPNVSRASGRIINDPSKGLLIDTSIKNSLSSLENLQKPGSITYDPTKKSEYYGGSKTANVNPKDYNGAIETVRAHEIAHAIDTYPSDLSEKEKNIISSSTEGWSKRLPNLLTPELWEMVQDAKHIEKPEELRPDLNALRFLMYDKGVYDIREGKKFTKQDLERAKEKLKGNPSLDRTLMLTGEDNFINLMNVIAQNNDEDITPIANNGASLPGATGMMYARTAGSAPSKGKYAKKTMASAQKGKNIPQDETRIDSNLSDKIARLELQQSPEYQYRKYQQSLPQLRQAPGFKEKALRAADVTTDVMQLANFIPHPAAQFVGRVGNVAGGIIDFGQAVGDVTKGDYLSAGVNLGSAIVPNYLGAKGKGYLRSIDNVKPKSFADKIGGLTEKGQFYRPLTYAKPSHSTNAAIRKGLNFNRSVLGSNLTETAYDAFPNSEVVIDREIKHKPLTTPAQSKKPYTDLHPGILQKITDDLNLKSEQNINGIYGRKSYYPIDEFQTGGRVKAQDGLKTVSTTSPEYKQLYENRQIGRWLDNDTFDSQVPLDEVVVRGNDERVLEGMRNTRQGFLEGVGTAMSFPQQEMVRMITGKERQFPSEAWGFDTTNNSWYHPKSISNFAMDAVLDPTNLIGVGLVDDLSKGAIRQGLQQTGKYLTEETALKNAHKLNPYAFKPQEGMMYRGLGKEGTEDALQSGVFRARPARSTVPDASGIRLKVKGFGDVYFSPEFEVADRYGKGFIGEVPKNSANWKILDSPRHASGWSQFSETPIPIDQGRILQKDWLKGYKEVPKPTSSVDDVGKGLESQIVKSSFPNPIQIADKIIPRPLAPGHLLGIEDSWNNYSPINLIPGYGEKLIDASSSYPNFVGFRKFGNSIDDVIESQSLRPNSSGMGSSQIKREGNWAEPGRVNEHYSGVFEATMNPQVEGSDIKLEKWSKRNGIVGTTKEGDVAIPLTDPGLSFNRRLPFSNRYVPIDKQKLIDKEFQLATQLPHLQSLAEKYGIWSSLGLGASYLGVPTLHDANKKYIINPTIEKYKKLNDKVTETLNLPKWKNGGIIEDDMGYWNPDNHGKPVRVNSNVITMEGVYEPLLGISDTGDTKLMEPGKNYKFKGKKVTEFPIARLGINQLDAQPMKKLNQLTNFTNNPDKTNWLDKYN